MLIKKFHCLGAEIFPKDFFSTLLKSSKLALSFSHVLKNIDPVTLCKNDKQITKTPASDFV